MRHDSTRRTFIRRTLIGCAGAGALGLGSGRPWAGNEIQSDAVRPAEDRELGSTEPLEGALARVVEISHPGATRNLKDVDPAVAQQMLDRGLLSLTGTHDLRDAWQKLIPDLTSDQTIGVKINTSYGMTVHKDVVLALAASLVAVGVAPERILVWERREKDLNRGGLSNHAKYQTFRAVSTDAGGFGYDDEVKAIVGERELKLSTLITRHCDHLINVPVLKTHNLAGVTLALKNHYGSIPLGDNLPWSLDDMPFMHLNQCTEQIAELNSVEPIRSLTRLVICDGLTAIIRGGPTGAPQERTNRMLFATDPVAHDTCGLSVLEELRKQRGLAPIGAEAAHVARAAERGLGVGQRERIEFLRENMHS